MSEFASGGFAWKVRLLDTALQLGERNADRANELHLAVCRALEMLEQGRTEAARVVLETALGRG